MSGDDNICDLDERTYRSLEGQTLIPVKRGEVGDVSPDDIPRCAELSKSLSKSATGSLSRLIVGGASRGARAVPAAARGIGNAVNTVLGGKAGVLLPSISELLLQSAVSRSLVALGSEEVLGSPAQLQLWIDALTFSLFLVPSYHTRADCQDKHSLHRVPARFVTAGGVLARIALGAAVATTNAVMAGTASPFQNAISRDDLERLLPAGFAKDSWFRSSAASLLGAHIETATTLGALLARVSQLAVLKLLSMFQQFEGLAERTLSFFGLEGERLLRVLKTLGAIATGALSFLKGVFSVGDDGQSWDALFREALVYGVRKSHAPKSLLEVLSALSAFSASAVWALLSRGPTAMAEQAMSNVAETLPEAVGRSVTLPYATLARVATRQLLQGPTLALECSLARELYRANQMLRHHPG